MSSEQPMREPGRTRHYKEITTPKPAVVRSPQSVGTSRDAEKGWAPDEQSVSQETALTDNDTVAAANAWPDMLEDEGAHENLLKILLYLAFLNSPLTLLLSIYGLISAFVVTLFSPITCFVLKDKPPLAGQIIRTLSPVVRFHLRPIDSQRMDAIHPRHSSSASRLLWSVLGSPAVSGIVSLAAWVAIVFWIYASIIGEPTNDGRGREKEGRRAVRWVRDAWERWLLWSLG